MEGSTKRKREMETELVEKVSEVISAIKSAKHVDEVVCALHSLALLLFPLDSSLLSGQSPSSFPLLVNCAKRTENIEIHEVRNKFGLVGGLVMFKEFCFKRRFGFSLYGFWNSNTLTFEILV